MTPSQVGTLNKAIHKVLTNGLAMRFGVFPRVARKYLLEDVEQWGKLCRLEGGDIMHAYKIVSKCIDGQDVTFIRVRDLIVTCVWEVI